MWLVAAALLLVGMTGTLRATPGKNDTLSLSKHPNLPSTPLIPPEDLSDWYQPHRFSRFYPRVPKYPDGPEPWRIEPDGVVIDHQKFFISAQRMVDKRIWPVPGEGVALRKLESFPFRHKK